MSKGRLPLFFNAEKYADVILDLYDGENLNRIYVHRIILDVQSEFFEALFRKPPQEIINTKLLYMVHVKNNNIAIELIEWMYNPNPKDFLFRWQSQADIWLVFDRLSIFYGSPIAFMPSKVRETERGKSIQLYSKMIGGYISLVRSRLTGIKIFEIEINSTNWKFFIDFINETIDRTIMEESGGKITECQKSFLIVLRFPTIELAKEYYDLILRPYMILSDETNERIDNIFKIK